MSLSTLSVPTFRGSTYIRRLARRGMNASKGAGAFNVDPIHMKLN